MRDQIANGVPSNVARQLAGLYASIRDGEATAVQDGVRRALGRQASTFEDYVVAAAAAGAWNAG